MLLLGLGIALLAYAPVVLTAHNVKHGDRAKDRFAKIAKYTKLRKAAEDGDLEENGEVEKRINR